MTPIVQWLATYSLPIALLITMGATLIFVLTLVCERSVPGTMFIAEWQPLGVDAPDRTLLVPPEQDSDSPTGVAPRLESSAAAK
jgi:hypothetical protein